MIEPFTETSEINWPINTIVCGDSQDVLHKLPTLKCTRCKHTWIRRKETEPKTCPKCNSPYWNKKRVRPK